MVVKDDEDDEDDDAAEDALTPTKAEADKIIAKMESYGTQPAKVPGPVAADGTLIRSFYNQGIQAQIDKAIATLPPDTHGAVIAYATTKGASLAIVGKKEVGPGELAWTVVAKKPYDGPVEAEAAVKYTW